MSQLALSAEETGFSADELRRILRLSPLPPPPPDPTNAVADDPRAARLGQALFFDGRLSADGTVSCATCHVPSRAFADGRDLGRGLAELDRHTPALWNLADNRWFFWDGRADTLWSQALQPLRDPREMGATREQILDVLRADQRLRADYIHVFGDLPAASASEAALDTAFVNVGKALAAYQRRLVSDRAPFDVFVEGLREGSPDKLAALSESARAGLKLFVGRANCHLCHSGPNFTDREFHSTRVPPLRPELAKDPGRQRGIDRLLTDPFNSRSAFTDDGGRLARETLDFLQPRVENLGQFKTPSLRNVALTAPYMHQGQFATLRDVLNHYSRFEVVHDPLRNHFELMLQPLHLTEQELADLLAFLESLTDADLDPGLLGPPAD
ncbi:MAG: cytochrome-c peroxidase [Planctomycetota bacterium]